MCCNVDDKWGAARCRTQTRWTICGSFQKLSLCSAGQCSALLVTRLHTLMQYCALVHYLIL